MFRTPPGGDRPRHVLSSDKETFREFALPIAHLARPEDGWQVLVGRSGTDGYLTDVDLSYVDVDARDYRVRVRSSRPVPEHFRVRPEPVLDAFLAETVANFTDQVLSGYLTGHGPFAEPAEPGEAVLHIDGQACTARAATRDGFFAATVEIGDLTVMVSAPEELRDLARDLTLRHPGQS